VPRSLKKYEHYSISNIHFLDTWREGRFISLRLAKFVIITLLSFNILSFYSYICANIDLWREPNINAFVTCASNIRHRIWQFLKEGAHFFTDKHDTIGEYNKDIYWILSSEKSNSKTLNSCHATMTKSQV